MVGNKLYHEMVQYNQTKETFDESQQYEGIHLVCGESAAGLLTYSLGSQCHKIIGFPDFFAEGPLQDLHNEEGFQKRHQWLMEHLNMENNFLKEEYPIRFRKTLEQIKTLPENYPILLWMAENANEQIGLRYFLYLLQNHANEMYVINTALACKEVMKAKEVQTIFNHTGEVHPELIRAIYEQKLFQPLTKEERQMYQNEWVELAKTDGMLRIWQDNKIQTVSEDYYDAKIIQTAKKLHSKQEQVDFVKAARIVGNLLGYVAGQISDAYLEYRIRCLVNKGIFEIKGNSKEMSNYSVRLS